jgi:hypothetical protein
VSHVLLVRKSEFYRKDIARRSRNQRGWRMEDGLAGPLEAMPNRRRICSLHLLGLVLLLLDFLPLLYERAGFNIWPRRSFTSGAIRASSNPYEVLELHPGQFQNFSGGHVAGDFK